MPEPSRSCAADAIVGVEASLPGKPCRSSCDTMLSMSLLRLHAPMGGTLFASRHSTLIPTRLGGDGTVRRRPRRGPRVDTPRDKPEERRVLAIGRLKGERPGHHFEHQDT